MKYKELEEKSLHLLSEAALKMWLKTLYKKAKQISHSEKLHKHDAVFWKRLLSKQVSKEQMQTFCEMVDESRKNIKG